VITKPIIQNVNKNTFSVIAMLVVLRHLRLRHVSVDLLSAKLVLGIILRDGEKRQLKQKQISSIEFSITCYF
jgi:hypothetical protein